MKDLVALMRTRREREPWERNLVVLWVAQLIAMIGMSACIPFLPLFVRDLGVPAHEAAMWSGIITAAPFVFSSLLTPVWGALGDRYGQKTMVMRAILGLGIAMTLMGFAPNIWWLLGLRIFQGAASGFIAASNAFVSTQTPLEKTGVALGTIQTSISAGNIIGPLIGGVISDMIGFRSVFFFVGAMCLSSLYIIWKHLTEQQRSEQRTTTRVRGNIALVMQSQQLRVLLVMILLSQIALVLPSPIFPYYLEELGAPRTLLSTLSGVVVSIVGLTTIISAPWWGKRGDRQGFRSTLFAAGSIICGGMLLQSIVPSYGWLIPLRACIGLASGAMLPMMYSELTRNAPAGSTGGIMGLASSSALIGNLVGPLACSMIASSIELEWIFVTSSLVMASVVWSSSTVTWSRPNSHRHT